MGRNTGSAKLIVEIESNRITGSLYTASVYDNRTQEYWPADRIAERGIMWFLNVNDARETLNWNLNGDERKYMFRWVHSTKTRSTARALIFD